MDVLNRLKSAVTNVLPVGNPITGEFEILNQRASGGPGMLWKVFDGIQRSTKQEASVFVFEKKHLERFTKHDRDIILEVMKKGVSQLTRLRHPKILSVLHPLEDSRESIAFTTERILCSVANVLGQHDNLPQSALASLKDYTLFDVEIKYGLLQVIEGLGFLHNSVHMVHCNVCPESVFINAMGCWKISGFEFCIPNANQQSQQTYYPIREWDPHLSPIAQPKLNYLAPEYALTSACDTASDMFAVGVFIHALYNGGRPVVDSMSEWATFKKNVEQLKTLKVSLLSNIPEEVREHLKLLLNVEPSIRPDADQLSKIPFFEDVGVMALQYLDMLVQKDNLQKSQFFKGLSKVIDKLPPRVNMQRVFPSLCKECVNNNMVPFVLPNMMLVAEQASNDDFTKHVFPAFIPLFRITDPLQVMLIFLQNMNLLLSKTSPADIRNHVLPMIARALEADQLQIQELCLSIIPSFAGLVEYTSLKNSIIPRIRKLCLSATTLSVRVNCLVCLGKILEHLDRWYVMDEVLPMLQEIPSREPAVLLSILGIYKVTLTHKKLGITKELLATKIVPFLFPLCIDNGLNLIQFNAFMSIVKDMIGRVESEQRTKLEQLNSVQQEQKTLQQFAQESMQTSGNNVVSANGDRSSNDSSVMDSFMTGIGFGSFASPSTARGKKSSPAGASAASILNSDPTPTPVTSSSMKTSTSLTMEDKSRLAREQELQQQFKSQSPLQAQQAAGSTTKPAVRDLSSTLLSSSIRPPQPTSGGTMASSSGLIGSMDLSTSSSGPRWTPGVASSSSVAWNGPPPVSKPSLVASGNSGATKSVDLSAFDSIMPMGSKTRPTLGEMSTGNVPPRLQGPNPFGTSTAVAPQFSSTGSGMTFPASSSGMFQGPGMMVGNPAGFGNPGFGFSGQNMMGGGMVAGGGMGFGQPTAMPLMRPQSTGGFSGVQSQQNAPTALSNKDIADLLG